MHVYDEKARDVYSLYKSSPPLISDLLGDVHFCHQDGCMTLPLTRPWRRERNSACATVVLAHTLEWLCEDSDLVVPIPAPNTQVVAPIHALSKLTCTHNERVDALIMLHARNLQTCRVWPAILDQLGLVSAK